MVVTDPIADMLTRIRNALVAKHETVDVPASNMKKAVAQILLSEGFIKGVEVIENGVQGTLRLTLKYGAGKERIRPWYYAMSLLCRYFPQGAQILASGVSGVGGVRSMFGRTEKGVTLAVVNTDSERTVELTLENPQPGLSDLALYVYAPGRLRLGGERLLPVERGVALAPGSRISLAPETMLVYTSME